MYTASRRGIAVAADSPRQSGDMILPLNKTNIPPRQYRDQGQEPETLMAAISLAAVLLTLLTSLAMKLWIG
jgi:hypothetical protein